MDLNFTDEQMQAMVDGMMEELEAKNKKSADFFKHEFQDTLYLYVNHLKKEGSLDDESYSFPFDREKYAIAYEIIEQFASNTNYSAKTHLARSRTTKAFW
jgi:hypothetical protein